MMMAALCSCSGLSLTDPADKVSERFLGVSTISTETMLDINHGDTVSQYQLSVGRSRGGDALFTVLAPEEISGVAIVLGSDSMELKYQGVVLETGFPVGAHTPPLKIVARLLDCFERRVTLGAGEYKQNGQALYKILYDDSFDSTDYTYEICYDAESLDPISSNIYVNGTCVITVSFNSFTAE